ncbi:MAG: hypothetical protein WBN66_11715, partial [Smithella sp.]
MVQSKHVFIRFIISNEKSFRTPCLIHQMRKGSTLVRSAFRNKVLNINTAKLLRTRRTAHPVEVGDRTE